MHLHTKKQARPVYKLLKRSKSGAGLPAKGKITSFAGISLQISKRFSLLAPCPHNPTDFQLQMLELIWPHKRVPKGWPSNAYGFAFQKDKNVCPCEPNGFEI